MFCHINYAIIGCAKSLIKRSVSINLMDAVKMNEPLSYKQKNFMVHYEITFSRVIYSKDCNYVDKFSINFIAKHQSFITLNQCP